MTAEEQRDLLTAAVCRALKHFDALDLDTFFAEFEKEKPHPWAQAIFSAQDELRPALRELGLDYHRDLV